MNNIFNERKGTKQISKSGTVEDIKEGVGMLEKLANIFISIVSLFKSDKK